VRSIEHGTLADDEARQMMADHGIFLTSTLSSNFWMLNTRNKKDIPQFMKDKAEEVSKIRRKNLKRSRELGVKVAMGTDAGTPYNYHGRNAMELVQYVELGIMSEKEAIVASTATAADAIGLADQVGILEKGKLADCLVLDENPLTDIHVLAHPENIRLVFKEGQLISGKVDTSQWTQDFSLEL